MLYFITNNNQPATLSDAKAVQKSLKAYGVAPQADVCHVECGYGIRTERDDIWQMLPDGMDVIPVEYVHIEGTYTRNLASRLIQEVKYWGGRVNYAAEAFENAYLDLDIIKRADSGLVLYMAKSMAL